MEERRVLAGNPVSKGQAKAEAFHYEPLMLNVEAGYFKAGKETEYWKKFKAAQDVAKQELLQLQQQVADSDEQAAKIFMAHIAILEDEDLEYEIRNAILNDRMYPELAIEACFGEVIAEIRDLEDLMQTERASDIYDVKRRLLCHYLGKADCSLTRLDRDVIVVAKDLLPSDVATIDRIHVKGIVTEKEATNSHAVVLARSYAIPMITGVAGVRDEIANGEEIQMNAFLGTIETVK